MLRISTSFVEESEERSSFFVANNKLRSLIGLLIIIAVRNFQRFSDRSFISAYELIFVLKLD